MEVLFSLFMLACAIVMALVLRAIFAAAIGWLLAWPVQWLFNSFLAEPFGAQLLSFQSVWVAVALMLFLIGGARRASSKKKEK